MSLPKKLLYILLIAVILSGSFFSLISKKQALIPSSQTQTGQVTDELNLKLPSRQLTALTVPDRAIFVNEKEYLSEEKSADFPFDALSAAWESDTPLGTRIDLYVRFFGNGAWTSWQELNPDTDEAQKKDHKMYGFIFTDKAEKFQYKALLFSEDKTQTPYLKKISFTYYNSAVGPDPTQIVDSKQLLASLSIVDNDNPPIIPRASWGANEDLRYTAEQKAETLDEKPEDTEKYDYHGKVIKVVTHDEAGRKYLWPLEYTDTVKRFVIHHTATTANLDNPSAAIRNIYYYHAVTRGWGDIGYNYIIDPQGRIYEGRAGGEKVVGAHAGYANAESIGIGVLGNYSKNEVPYPVIQSLINLISGKAKTYQIEANGFSAPDTEMLPNILGHRDVANTVCPGDRFYSKLPYIRTLVAYNNGVLNTKDDFTYEEKSDRKTEILEPESTRKITVKLQNNGNKSWDDKTYLAVLDYDVQDRIVNLSLDNPDRVALLKEKSVAPNGMGTFEFTLTSNVRSGFVNFRLVPIFNGERKSNQEIMLPVYVSPPILSHTLVEGSYPSGRYAVNSKINTGWVKLQNTGNISWQSEGETKTCLAKVGETTCIGFLQEKIVSPNGIGSFVFNYSLEKVGVINEQVVPIVQTVGVSTGQILNYSLVVEGKSLLGEFVETGPENVFRPLTKKNVYLKIKNIGEKSWSVSGFNKLTVTAVKNKDITIENITLPDKDIAPGEIAEIKFDLTTPRKQDSYKVYFWVRVGKKAVSKTPFYFPFIVTRKSGVVYKSNEPQIRIALSYKGTPVISGDGDFDLYVNNGFKDTFSPGSAVEVSYKEGKYILKVNRNAYTYLSAPQFVGRAGTIMEIKNWDHRNSWDKETNYNRFRGALEVQNVDNELVVVNQLSIENYLKGLSEEPNDAPYEKIKAIIVAARSYAAFYTKPENRKFPGKPYDGSDDPAIFQKYSGYSYELKSQNVIKAVNQTKGEVVTYEGKLVKTPYFSQDDGKTKSAKEVFGWDAPYLQSVDDPYCLGLEMRGHGVGMSGCGAYGAAKEGKTYREILKYYYQGTEIQKLW